MSGLTALDVLDRTYLELRAKLLEMAAILDRIDRSPGRGALADARLSQLAAGLDILRGDEPHRAEAVQLLFSDPYAPDWKRPHPRIAGNGAAPD